MEEGKLTVNDRAGKYIRRSKKHRYSRAPRTATWTTVAAKRPITIRDLLTHTAGINYGQGPDFARTTCRRDW
jgi:CubicO group peptidase (beta-lactamase class C family)